MKYLLAILLIIRFLGVSAQKKMPVSLHISLKVDTVKLRKYAVPKTNKKDEIKTIVLRMNYGEAAILNQEDASELIDGSGNVLSVDIIYTDFHKQDVQDKLNRKRLVELYFMAPDIFSQSLTEWKYVEQLGYYSEDDARKLFHGIVIRYMKVKPYAPPSVASIREDLIKSPPKDSTVTRVFNKYPAWKKDLIVADFTGSMSPYYFQVFAWFALKKIEHPTAFSFFNDGDNTPDHLKRIGSTGGINLFSSGNVDSIITHAFETISKGSGGDCPENNVEAIVKAIKKYPDTKEVILIADNWADMRDYSMISEIKKPVHVLLCGTTYAGISSPLNTQYLDLAKQTGGTVHTIDEDIVDLVKMNEGSDIKIGKILYSIRGGRFIKKMMM